MTKFKDFLLYTNFKNFNNFLKFYTKKTILCNKKLCIFMHIEENFIENFPEKCLNVKLKS